MRFSAACVWQMHPIIILLLVNVLPVAKLRGAGVVIVGKTNEPEFTIEGYTDNPLFGVTPNPWDLTVMPGGSSGRSVAAVASGRTNGGGLPIGIRYRPRPALARPRRAGRGLRGPRTCRTRPPS